MAGGGGARRDRILYPLALRPLPQRDGSLSDDSIHLFGCGSSGMKAAFFSSVFYLAPAPGGWPTPANTYSADAAKASMRTALEQFRLADAVGFDWVTVAEHHYGPFGLTPNPMVFAGALTQVVKRAKIALLGPTLPILNPVRVAEEYAMLD